MSGARLVLQSQDDPACPKLGPATGSRPKLGGAPLATSWDRAALRGGERVRNRHRPGRRLRTGRCAIACALLV